MRTARIIETLVRAGIPVMGHIGLTPQSINTVGKVRVQGKTRDQARALVADALAVQEAGAFAMVLELVPGAARRGHHGAAAHPDHRHRRRCRLQRPGPGLHGPASGWATSSRATPARTRTSARRSARLRPPTPRTSTAGTFPGRGRDRSAWTTRSSTRCSVVAHPIARPARSRPAASRSTATSKPRPLDRRSSAPAPLSATPWPGPRARSGSSPRWAGCTRAIAR